MNAEDTNTSENETNNNHCIEPIYLYQWIDCCDEYNKWYEAQIIDISPSCSKQIKVHYKGWKSKFDTWIDLNNKTNFNRVCLLHTHSKKPYNTQELSKYEIGIKCDCLDSTDKWYQASIVKISENNKLLKIHYNGWDSKYDEWINKDSYRIAPLHTNTKPKSSKNTSPIKRESKAKPKPNTNSNTNSHANSNNNNNNNNVRILEAVEPDYDSEIKNDDPQQTDTITEEQRNKNRIVQEKYLSNFKPSLADEEQFALKLSGIGLYIESMGEDGNCLFRSISHQVYGKQDFHMIIRKKCVEYLKSEYEYFGSYVPGGHDKEIFNNYCLRMSCNGVWGDNLEIQAFSEIYERRIEIYAYDDKPMKTFSNDNINNNNNIQPIQPIRLSYHCNSHYNSIINPQIFEENIINSSKIGQIEDEKIRLSSLRTIHASQQTLNISDIEATELQLFNKILQLSRKNFNGNDENNKQLDIAIKKSLQSLAEYENQSVQNAVKESLYQQEQVEIAMALKKSQYDFMNFQHQHTQQIGPNNNNFQSDNNNNFSNHNMNNNNNGNNNYNFSTNDPKSDPKSDNNNNNNNDDNVIDNSIKILVDKGYSLEQATLAYSVFESQKHQIPKQVFIQRMIDYIENTKKASIFGYQNFYNLE